MHAVASILTTFCRSTFYFTGVQTTITVNVHTPKDFPVDLYYLTDVSRSIKKESIKSLGQLLGKRQQPQQTIKTFFQI